MTPSSTLARAAALCLLVACAGAPALAPGAPPSPVDERVGMQAPSAGLLSRFAGLTVMVLPTQAISPLDSLGWRTAGGGDKSLLEALDAVLADSLTGRGLGAQWVFPPALRRAASRNPTYVTDPSALRALDAVRVALRKRDEPLAEPFASQLRALAGVSDARYVLIPLDLRFAPVVPGTSGRAALRLAVVDARGAQLVWVGEVAGDPSPAFGSVVFASLAQRVADLVVPR